MERIKKTDGFIICDVVNRLVDNVCQNDARVIAEPEELHKNPAVADAAEIFELGEEKHTLATCQVGCPFVLEQASGSDQ